MSKPSPAESESQSRPVVLKVGGEEWNIHFQEIPDEGETTMEYSKRRGYVDLHEGIEEVRANIWAVLLQISSYYGGNLQQMEKFSEEEWIRRTTPTLSSMLVQNKELVMNILEINPESTPKQGVNSRKFNRTIKYRDDKWKLKTEVIENSGETRMDTKEIVIHSLPFQDIAETRNIIIHEILHVCGYYGEVTFAQELYEDDWINEVAPPLARLVHQNKTLIYKILFMLKK